MEEIINKGKYRTITLRVPWTDTAVLAWLDSQHSMNNALINLIRADLGLMEQNPEPDPIREYEVIEVKGRFKVTLASFDELKEAEHFAKVMLTVFDDSERIMIVKREKRGVFASENVVSGKVIKTFEQKKEEKENA